MSRFYNLLILLLFIMGCANDSERVQPIRMDITEWVYASVSVQPDSLYKAFASVGGILEEVYVEEGDTVRKGASIFKIKNTNPELNTQRLELDYQLARENLSGNNAVLKTLSDQIAAARLKMSNDSINFCRQSNLWEQQIGSQAEYDSKQLAYQLARKELNQLENEYRRTRSELETRVRQTELAWRSSIVTTGDYIIESKINGQVYGVYKEVGEVVNSLEPMAALGSSKTFLLNLLVDEVDIVRVIEGQRVVVSLDAYPKQVFDARVSKIIPDKDMRNQTFVVEALFSEQPDVLYPGLSGEANIAIRHKRDALVIPVSFLWQGNSVKTKDSLLEVETGIRNFDFVEILSGLDDQQWLIRPSE